MFKYGIMKFGKAGFSSVVKHSKVVISGGGTGGMAVANQLKNQSIVKAEDITIFDPAQSHYYQPGFTKIAGGIIKKKSTINNWVRYDMKSLASKFNFFNESVKTLDPEHNKLKTSNGEEFSYDHLIVAAGLQLKLDSIPGLKKLMDDPNKMVGTIYDFNYCQKVSEMRKHFKGGRALFTQPPAPLKCGGAPQKMVYLCDDYWKSNKIKADVHFFTPLPQMFAVDYYSRTLEQVVKAKGISAHYTTELVSVSDGVAKFKNNTNGQIFEEKYDFLHAIPHLGAPDFLKGSAISNPSGFVEVDRGLRHKKYSNIWALGDCIALPNAKTAAAAYSEAPVLVHNLKTALEGKNTFALYDGYSACPLYLGKHSLLLAEFYEHPDKEGKLVRGLDESFRPGKQNIPSNFYYTMTCSCTYIYRLGLKGLWFGKNSIIRPKFDTNSFNIRKLYKYLYYAYYLIPALLIYTFIGI
jgi:NADH dehydrogenase FAD-containing subunit